jgi:hypothetical protein
LEVYQKNFLDFVYGSPISTKAVDKDEEVKVGSSGIAQRGGRVDKKVTYPRKKNSRGGSIDKKTTRPHMRGPRREKVTNDSRTRVGGDFSNNRKKGIQDTSPKNRTTH